MAKPYVKLTEQSMMGIARPAVYEGFFLPIAKTNKKKTNKQANLNKRQWVYAKPYELKTKHKISPQ